MQSAQFSKKTSPTYDDISRKKAKTTRESISANKR